MAEGELPSPPHFAVDTALSAVSDPSGPFFAGTATRSPTASFFDESFSSVTGVFGGTVTFWEPPAYWTTRFDPLVLLTLPFDILDCDAVPLVIREAETLPFVIRLGPALAAGGIMRLPSPTPRSSAGKTCISAASSEPPDCVTAVTPIRQ